MCFHRKDKVGCDVLGHPKIRGGHVVGRCGMLVNVSYFIIVGQIR
jgi:hypothetical protein